MNFCQGPCSIYAVAAASAEGKLQWCHSVSGHSAGGSKQSNLGCGAQRWGKEVRASCGISTKMRKLEGIAVSQCESGLSLLWLFFFSFFFIMRSHTQTRLTDTNAHVLQTVANTQTHIEFIPDSSRPQNANPSGRIHIRPDVFRRHRNVTCVSTIHLFISSFTPADVQAIQTHKMWCWSAWHKVSHH